MVSGSVGGDADVGGRVQEFVLDRDNTFRFIPGPMTGTTCPACLRDQLLVDILEDGRCNGCGAALELRLRLTPEE